MRQSFDIVVIGGGPSGTASAITLAHSGYSVAIIERTQYDQARVGETLPPSARVPLADLGVWEEFIGTKPIPSHGILSCWGSPEPQSNDFIFDPYGNGWHIDRCEFDSMLARAAESVGAKIFRGSRVIECSREANTWQIKFMEADDISGLWARALIDATGRAASMAGRLGAKRISYDQLIGVIRFLSPRETVPPHDSMLVEATPNGWWYSAPLPNARLVVAFMTDADLWATYIHNSQNAWLSQLEHAPYTRKRVKAYTSLITKPLVRAANSSHLDVIAGECWLATGDAALSFDPLSAQGIQKSLEAGMASAHASVEQLKNKQSAVRDYAHAVQTDFISYQGWCKYYYGQELRWPDSLFWQRRQ